MANHFHKTMVVEDPETFSKFIGYIKGESARCINRLFGIKKRTIWCDGYDSPIVLCPEKALEKIIYLYANPSKARLVDSIDSYPGVSSWDAYSTGKHEKKVRYFRPSTIEPLPSHNMTRTEQLAYLERLKKKNKIFHKLKVQPDAWMTSFRSLAVVPAEKINEMIKNKLNKEEECHKNKGPCMGAGKLRKQPLNLRYQKNKYGRCMFVSDSDTERRKSFIGWFKVQSHKARQAIKSFKESCTFVPLPPGFYGPGNVLHANLWNFMDWVGA